MAPLDGAGPGRARWRCASLRSSSVVASAWRSDARGGATAADREPQPGRSSPAPGDPDPVVPLWLRDRMHRGADPAGSGAAPAGDEQGFLAVADPAAAGRAALRRQYAVAARACGSPCGSRSSPTTPARQADGQWRASVAFGHCFATPGCLPAPGDGRRPGGPTRRPASGWSRWSPSPSAAGRAAAVGGRASSSWRPASGVMSPRPPPSGRACPGARRGRPGGRGRRPVRGRRPAARAVPDLLRRRRRSGSGGTAAAARTGRPATRYRSAAATSTWCSTRRRRTAARSTTCCGTR